MLQMFRSFFKSKWGVAFTLVFLAVMAVAFVSSDSLTGMTGAVSRGDTVAVIGDAEIDAVDLDTAVREGLRQAQQQNPALSMEAFLANDGLDDALDGLISRQALQQMATASDLLTGRRLVDSEISQNPNLRGADGNFSQDTFLQALQQLGMTEAEYRADVQVGLLAQMLLTPLQAAPQMPASMARRYSALGLETRTGAFAVLPARAFAPTGAPTQAQLNAFYGENQARYIRPERRVIRYAVFGEEAFGNLPAPTDAQIAARYQRDRELYAARETRRFTQLVVTTRAAAQAILAEVNGGTSLEASARAKGLSTTSVALTDKDDFAQATSAAVANAAFAAARGGLSAPAQGSIGWYIMRVDEVASQGARALPQLRGEITEALRVEQRRAALNEATSRIDEEFSDGKSLSDVARELNLTLTQTRPVTAAGQVYGTAESAPPQLAPVLATAFEMEESEPQLAETVAGEQFVVFDISQITSSAAAPLAEIREQVVAAWRTDEGMKRAGAAANRVMQRVGSGTALVAALAAENQAGVPGVQQLRMTRQEIEQAPRVTRPMILFFSMAKGTTKVLEVAEQGAWFLVSLADVVSEAVPADSPRVAAQREQLARLLPEEYSAQFVSALRGELEVEVNDEAVAAVRAGLSGSGN